MSWRNDDGLLVKFGTEKADVSYGGFISGMAGKLVYEFDIDLTDSGISTTDAQVPRTDTLWVPSGLLVEKVTVLTTEVPTGATANLDLGLAYYSSGTLTELDYDGLLALADFGDFGALGDINEYTQGSTEHGALVGTILAATNDKYVFTCSEDTAAFTAGALRIRVEGSIPTGVGV